MKLKRTLLILISSLIISSCSLLLNSYKSEIDGIYIPKNIPDALHEIDKFYNDSIKIEIKSMTEDDFLGNYHMGTGLWIRNNWNLWKGSRLSHYFKRKGVKHPDVMSSILLTSYHRFLIGKDLDIKGQIKASKQYAREAKRTYNQVKLPPKSEYPEANIQITYSMGYKNQGRFSILYFQTNSQNDSLWIYDHLCGWKKIDKTMEKNLKYNPHNNVDSLLNVIFKK